MTRCFDCGFFKAGKAKVDHSHCTNEYRPRKSRKLEKSGDIEVCKLFKRPETLAQVTARIGVPKLTIRYIPLHVYVNWMKTDKYFSYVRYGDGEWKGLLRESGRNGRAHLITPEFHRDMLLTLFKNKDNFSVMFGLQRNTYRAEGRQEQIDSFVVANDLVNIPWVSAETFHHASRDGILFPFIEEARKRESVVIGPEFLKVLRESVFPEMHFVEVLHADCYQEKDRVIDEVSNIQGQIGDNAIYMFATGPVAEVFILELQEMFPNNFFIDVGSLFDIFVGQRTRKYTQDKINYTEEILKRNLGEIA